MFKARQIEVIHPYNLRHCFYEFFRFHVDSSFGLVAYTHLRTWIFEIWWMVVHWVVDVCVPRLGTGSRCVANKELSHKCQKGGGMQLPVLIRAQWQCNITFRFNIKRLWCVSGRSYNSFLCQDRDKKKQNELFIFSYFAIEKKGDI